MPARNRGVTIGNTRGGRGTIPANIQTQADYYRSGRSSALNPGGTVRGADGRALNRGGARS